MNSIIAAYDPTFAKEIYQWVNDHPEKFDNLILTGNDCVTDQELSEILTTIIHAQHSGEYDYEYDDDPSPSTDGSQCEYIYRGGPNMHGRCFAGTKNGSDRCSYHNSIIFSNKLFEPLRLNELVEKVTQYEQQIAEQAAEIQRLKAKITDLKYRPGTGTSYQKAKERFENPQK